MCKMADPTFSDDYLRDDDDMFIKEEMDSPVGESLGHTSACVPIPTRRTLDNLSDCSSDYLSTSTLMLQDHDRYTTLNPNVLWSGKIEDNDPEETKMEDDIFQVDKSDLIQDSNLSDLNTNQNFLDDLNFDDLMLPVELSCDMSVPNIGRHNSGLHPLMNTPIGSLDSSYASSCLTENISLYRDSIDSSSLPSSPLNITTGGSSKTYMSLENSNNNSGSPLMLSPTHNSKHSSLHELLIKKESQGSSSKILGQSIPSGGLLRSRNTVSRNSPSSRLSSSAPTHLTMDQIWQRREPRQHLLSTGSLVEAGSTSSLSTGGVLSPEAYDFSLDEACDSEDESDQDDDYSSDGESSDGEGGSTSSKQQKKERYFWQYNVQSKGPKGQRLVLKSQLEDPHCLNEITDPVFSVDCSLQGIKHSGKARKGDGNDLTPNPKKLYVIGKELDKLNRVINDMTPVSELPYGVRPNTRKEKNKLASRACRLKKKAQHEANKIKLLGLETEHKRLINAIQQSKQLMSSYIAASTNNSENKQEMLKNMDKIVKHATKLGIAGDTTVFVNKILEKIKAGVPNGGLEEVCFGNN